ncbi:aldehyde dehydrogenase family protein [Devosia algicola]|uniref:Aldehyde dehydrogenase family protein n=1 Tax=Devosia algicola TaxID=3026418 RepID=A0ABY7YT69_9HYPH|nr:aldehyde dehydrogenase family protein [Devosia algicola]
MAGAFWANFGNNGQSCTAGSRLFVHKSIYDKVLDGLAAIAPTVSVGPGLDDPAHDLGPVISQTQLSKVLGFLQGGEGRVVTGGARLDRDGWFVPPTIIADVSDDMRLAREEVFGPVLAVLPFEGEDDVLGRANASPYGLAAGLWSRDVSRVRRIADRLQAGTVWVNCWGDTDAAAPFGGVKQSGYGREMGREAISLYTQTKCVWIN